MPDTADLAPDLVDRLAEAAAAAVRTQRPDLERRPEQLRSLHVELHVQQRGDQLTIDEATSYVERRVTVTSTLGLNGAGRR